MNKKELADRRRSGERRSAKRFSVTIDIEWERGSDRHSGTLSDLSEGGCFVLSGAEISDGDTIGLFIPIGDGMKVQFSGLVTNHVFEIGFAVRFDSMTEAQRNVLRNYLLGESGEA